MRIVFDEIATYMILQAKTLILFLTSITFPLLTPQFP